MKLAVIRVRGMIHVRKDIQDTMKLLNLTRKNHCVIVEDTPIIRGMLQKIHGYVTWGELDSEGEAALKGRKGEKAYALQPPRKGYGKRGIKVQFKAGGALGARGKEINKLIASMV